MVTKYPPVLFSQMLTLEDGEMSQIGLYDSTRRYLPLRVIHNKKLKGSIAACYETWLYEYP